MVGPSITFRHTARRQAVALTAIVAVTALVVTACSSGSGAPGDSSGSAGSSTSAATNSAGSTGSASAGSSALSGQGASSPAGGGATTATTLSTGQPFVLGVGLPLTGDQAQYGIGSQAADEAAAAYVNSHGGMDGHQLKLQFWDTVAQPATGVAGTHKFISDHVNGVVGYFNSDVTIPAVRLLQAAGIPLFGDNPSSPALATMGLKNFTRITGNDKNEGLVQADFVWNKLHLKTAVGIDDNEAFGQAFTQAFTDEYTKLGGKVVKHFSVDASVTDFGSIISQIKQLNPDCVEFSGFNPAAALLVKQIRAAGLKMVYITDSSQYGSDYTNIAGQAAVGSYMTNSPSASGTPTALYGYLTTALKAKNIEVTPIYATSFDAVLDAWHAADDARSISPADLIKVMHSVSFDGATGRVSFLSDGDRAQIRYTVVQVSPTMAYNVVYNFGKTLQ